MHEPGKLHGLQTYFGGQIRLLVSTDDMQNSINPGNSVSFTKIEKYGELHSIDFTIK